MKRTPPPRTPAQPTVPPEVGIEMIEELLRNAEELANQAAVDGPDVQAWNNHASELMTRALGADSPAIGSVLTTGGGVGFWLDMSEEDRQSEFRGQMRNKAKLLHGALDTLRSRLRFADRLGQGDSAREVAPSTLKSPLETLERLLGRFHSVAQRLKRRHADRATLTIQDEYDVQDLLHALLLIEFADVRPEESTPSYAGGNSRMDFLLRREETVVEVKHTRATLTDKDVGAELMVDIGRYRAHPNCKVLVCFVYDPQHLIKNPVGLEDDLSRSHDGLRVRVLVRPQP